MPRDTYYLPQRRLVSQDDGAIVKRADVRRSTFINRWQHLTTFDAGYLVPFLVNEVLPGDHMRYNVTAYLRMSTALFPMFSNQRVDTFFFFVPNRLVWLNWPRFMGEQPSGPTDSIAYTIPQVPSAVGGYPINDIFDHMGLPTVGQVDGAQTVTVSALPLRMYNLIWNLWFRDQNVQTARPANTNDGPDPVGDYIIMRRAKSHDYFTSALPWPQKFAPLQTLFTGVAPIIGLGSSAIDIPAAGLNVVETGGATVAYPFVSASDAAGARFYLRHDTNPAGGAPAVYANLAQATGVTINALRQAWLVQDLLERDARGGTRYSELIRSHFGVTNPDFRLQRPEYIGGGQTPINLTPIAQTTPTGGGGLGALGATGTAAGQHSASYAATEHGFIIGLINVRTELAYQQGIQRQWSRLVRQDHFFPALAGLGEQAILRQEIYASGVNADDALVFGYQERWQEYRTEYSTVSGMFRSTTAGNIDDWHLAQLFAVAPTLSTAFLEDTPPMTRVLAAGPAANNMQYLADILIDRTATRPVPTFGTPATLARF